MERVWRQPNMGVLSGPCAKFSKTYSDMEPWPESRLPRLDICRRLYRSV